MRQFIKIVEAASQIPTRSFDELWHVGSLNVGDKRGGSHEGAGLSVSLNPEEWRRIARGFVSGALWSVKKAGNKFLDYHRSNDAHKQMISDWAVANGFATRETLYRVSYFDDELDSSVYMDFASEDEARAEAYDDQEVEAIHGALVGTGKLRARTNSNAEPVMVPDLLATVYAEDILGFDGVWWDDRLDVQAYSAPRGVIVPSKVGSWTFNKITNESEEASTRRVVYHLTLARNLKKINTDGLIPRLGPRSKKLAEPKPAIYFFPTIGHVEDALMSWFGNEFSDEARIALLKVTIPDDIVVHSDAAYEMHVYDAISPLAIEVISKDVLGEVDIASLTR